MEQANTRLASEFVYGPGLLMDYKGPMPTPEETARAFPNAMGWWTPVENGAMFTGQWMPAVVARNDAALAKRLAEGLLKLSEVSDVPGFIARCVLEDGKSHWPCGSNDQTTPWLIGLWSYWRAPFAEQALKAKIAARCAEVARALEANGWWCPCDGIFKGQNRGGLKDTERPYYEAARFLFTLRALYEMTGDKHWFDLYKTEREIARDVVANGLPKCEQDAIGRTNDHWTYVSVAMALRDLIKLEEDPEWRAVYREGFRDFAARTAPYMADRKFYDNKKVDFLYANWREGYPWHPHTNQAVSVSFAASPRTELLGVRKWVERRNMTNPLCAAAICAAEGDPCYAEEIEKTLKFYDYSTPNISEFFWGALAGAYFEENKSAKLSPPPETDWMAGKIGAFVHYWPGIASREARKFDVEQLKRDLASSGVDYFFLTLGQNAGTYIAPNETYERITRRKRGVATSACNGRDLPREVIEALKGTGIKFCLYLPCRPASRAPEDCERMGYIPLPDGSSDCTDTPEGLKNWCKVIAEWSERYGRDVYGWWFDGAGGPGFAGDRETLAIRAAARRGNPAAVCAFAKRIVDYDHGYRWVLGMDRKEGRELNTLFTDYNCRGEARHDVWAGCDFTAGESTNPMRLKCEGREALGRQWFTLTYMGGMWGWTDCRHTDNVWIDWMKRVLPRGASVCFDIGFVHEDGRISPTQVAQLGRIVALVRGKADAKTFARHEREMRVINALRDVEHSYGRGCENPLVTEGRETAQEEIAASLTKNGAVFVNEGQKPNVLRGVLALKPGQVFIADKDAKFEAAPGERPVVKLADGVMFEGGTWKGVVFDLAGCKHFIFRRAWLEGCEVRTDGASECVIEYLDSPSPAPHQVFEIIPNSTTDDFVQHTDWLRPNGLLGSENVSGVGREQIRVLTT